MPFDEDWINRKQGAITKQDRKFLIGDLDMEEYANPASATTQRWTRIRERIRNTILDFVLLAETLSPREFDLMFDEALTNEQLDPESELHVALYSMVVIVVRMTEHPDVYTPLIEQAVNDALTRNWGERYEKLYTGFADLHLEADEHGELSVPFGEMGDSLNEMQEFADSYGTDEASEVYQQRVFRAQPRIQVQRADPSEEAADE